MSTQPRSLNALSRQAFIGYAPIEEGDDNEIHLHYTLSCDLSELLGATGVGANGSNTKVSPVTKVKVGVLCRTPRHQPAEQMKWKQTTRIDIKVGLKH